MDSPANPFKPREQGTITISRNLIKEANVEEEVCEASETHSGPDKIRILESVSDEMRKSQEAEEVDGSDQKLEVSIEEDEIDTMDSKAMSFSFNCHGGGPKRKKKNDKKRKQQEEKSKKKLKVLVQTLKLVPFKPFKTLDFARYESVLKTLGLWDFVHLEFDQDMDYGLVAQLIAYYSPEGRCSYINGSRIKLSRADLARALKLPNKRERVVILDEDKELLESDELISFVNEVVSNWMLLHCDDAWMMPDKVVEWKKSIKEKQLDKLDWAGLMWFMVEKVLKAEPPLGDCFYASHLQMVIRSQKIDLFREQARVENSYVKVEDLLIKSPEADTPREQSRVEDVEVKVGDLKVKDDIAALNLRMDDGASDSKEEKCVEEGMIELNLGKVTVSEMAAEEEHHPEEQAMDLEENKEQPKDLQETKEEGDGKWLLNEDSHAGSHFLQGCDVGGATVGYERNRTGHKKVGEYELEDEIEKDGEKHNGGFLLFPNGETLHQENLMLGDTSPLGYNSELQIHGNSTGDFMRSRAVMHMVPGRSHFRNDNKREIDHENDISYHFDNPASTKRLKTPYWDDKPVPFDVCMEQIKHLADKAKLSYAEKDRACGESNMREQMLLNELQRREEIIQQLHKKTYEEEHKKDVEIYKLENELRMMTSVLAWYQKALKETQKACRKHRKVCPLRDKPIYRDVKGTGGLVLSTAEIEKLRLKEEKEEGMRRALIERQVEEFGSLWIKEYEVNLKKKVELLDEKLTGFQNKVNLLKETVSRRVTIPGRFDATSDT
ncbi:uncharacterized protein LOC9317905 [Arabidopsis lyrata subsp. lyrata]|uniref:uncharacterized protein LOC9317905 n=1 Tax=Arabidopsis lyrata subsp. lyrata TaxID=81972 RepID=UPI000A29B778|nr:uncharacterized protein LOC9317905 [Arabidopsis lyrata subsp. lyrata]XP_020883487.1 uncharacterized protein LOC9317905 [Arabidopsis lyrata subsp. lyrata]|eukprot:XP_020883485.1 uncharacterized protein LOC9317905 [Arabidopsis lyrata subsp. lyrata]